MAGRQRCTDHSVTDCIVCFPRAKSKPVGDIPEVPSFPGADRGDLEEAVKATAVESIQHINPITPAHVSEPHSPLIAAAVQLTKATGNHYQAQKDLARAKEHLLSAEKYLESMYILKINAQEEMSKILEGFTDVAEEIK